MVMFFGVILGGYIGLTAGSPEGLIVPLLSTQILWINLLTDSGPALALGVEPANHDVMTLPPRDPHRRVIDRRMWFDILYVGVIMAVGTLLVVDWSLPGGFLSNGTGSLRYAQTMAFTTLVFFQLFNVFNSRSDHDSAFKNLFSNKWIWVAVAVSVLLQVVVVYVPLLQQAFGTMPLQPTDWAICIVIGSTVLWLREAAKLVMRLRA
jgi:Ca2+-transporting ATPase